jgi:hypothetical protein
VVTVAGAMSTAGSAFAGGMVRQDKIHGICCTGANLKKMCSIWLRTITTSEFHIIAN